VLGVNTIAAGANHSYSASGSSSIIISDSVGNVLNAANFGGEKLAHAIDITGSVASGYITSLMTLNDNLIAAVGGNAPTFDLSAANLGMTTLTGAQVGFLTNTGGATSSSTMTVNSVTGSVDLASVSNASTINLNMGAATGTVNISNANTSTSFVLNLTGMTGESSSGTHLTGAALGADTNSYSFSDVGGNLDIHVGSVDVVLVGMSVASHAGLTITS